MLPETFNPYDRMTGVVRCRAFTLVELLVVLIISSVLLLAVTTAYRHALHLQTLAKQQAQNATLILKLEYLLKRDFAKGNSYAIKGHDLDVNQVMYRFFADSITRTSALGREVFPFGGSPNISNDGFTITLYGTVDQRKVSISTTDDAHSKLLINDKHSTAAD